MERHLLEVTEFETPREAVETFEQKYGPTIAVLKNIGDDEARRAEFHQGYLDFAEKWNLAGEGEPARFEYEYMVIVGTRA